MITITITLDDARALSDVVTGMAEDLVASRDKISEAGLLNSVTLNAMKREKDRILAISDRLDEAIKAKSDSAGQLKRVAKGRVIVDFSEFMKEVRDSKSASDAKCNDVNE